MFLSELPQAKFHTSDALESARRFLRTVARENLIYPVYTAADITRIFISEPEIYSPWLDYLRSQGAAVEIIPGVGHFTQIEAAAEVNRLIADFAVARR